MRRVLVTGGATRLGRLIAEGLASADCQVVVHHHKSVAEAEDLVRRLRGRGALACAVRADLGCIEDAKSLIQTAAEAAGGPLTALVNNAAVFDYDSPQTYNATTFANATAVNLQAPIILSQNFHEQADAQFDNCIVNILDQKLWNLNPDFFSYTVSKYALRGVIEMTAMAFASKTRVCGIAPGILYPSYDQTIDEFQKVASINLLRQPIDHAEILRALLFILNTPGFNAQILHVDNGQRLVPLERDVMFSTRAK